MDVAAAAAAVVSSCVHMPDGGCGRRGRAILPLIMIRVHTSHAVRDEQSKLHMFRLVFSALKSSVRHAISQPSVKFDTLLI